MKHLAILLLLGCLSCGRDERGHLLVQNGSHLQALESALIILCAKQAIQYGDLQQNGDQGTINHYLAELIVRNDLRTFAIVDHDDKGQARILGADRLPYLMSAQLQSGKVTLLVTTGMGTRGEMLSKSIELFLP